MKITTSAWQPEQPIPVPYTADGDGINPPLLLSEVPPEAQSLVLIMDDPDAPSGTANPGWVHWVVYNIAPQTIEIETDTPVPGSSEGINDSGTTGYMGPEPPSGTHRYYFRVFAVDTQLNFDYPPTKAEVMTSINGHVLDSAELMGTYSKAE